MRKTKKLLATLLAVIMLFGTIAVVAQAASVNVSKVDYGDIIPTDAKFTKGVSTVKLYGAYDYINFYIDSISYGAYFCYEIYSDKAMTKLVASDYTYCDDFGTYTWTPLVKLKGVFKTGTFYGIAYAASIDGAGNVTISSHSVVQFKVVVNRSPKFNQQMVVLKSVSNTVNGPTIKWCKLSNNVSKYCIYRRSMTGTKWSKVATVKSSTLSYTDKSIKNKNAKYIYTVKAIDKSGKSSRYLYNGLYCLFAKAPKVSSVATTSDNRIQVKWNNTSNSARYKVYRSENGGSWKLIKNNYNGTTFYDTTARNGKNYKYTVRAVISTSNGIATSSYYNVNKTVDFLNQPTLNPVSVADNGLKITWGKVSGAKNYTVYKKTLEAGAKWAVLGKVSGDVTEFVDATANAASAFIYTVRSEGATSRGSYSSKGVEYLNLAQPEVTLESTETGAKIKWNKVENAQSYEIVKKNADNTWDLYAVIDGRYCEYEYYSDAGEIVTLSVRAVRKDVRSTFDENVTPVRVYPANTIGIVVYNEYSDITWEDVGADSYNLYKKTANSEFKLVYSGKDTKFKDTEVEFDVAYTYLLKGVWNDVEQPIRATERTYTKYSVEKCIQIKNSYQKIDANCPDDFMSFPGYYFDVKATAYGKDKSIFLYVVEETGEYRFTGHSDRHYANDGEVKFLNGVPTFAFVVSDHLGSSPEDNYIVTLDNAKCGEVPISYTKSGKTAKLTWKADKDAVKYLVQECGVTDYDVKTVAEITADGSSEYSAKVTETEFSYSTDGYSNYRIVAVHENGNMTSSYIWGKIYF